MSKVMVLRMGHRVFRDSRVTTHICLTARALGAAGVIIANRQDKEVEASVRAVVKRFGGEFHVETGANWRRVVSEWKNGGGRLAHLTVYGLPLPKVLDQVRESQEDLLVVVGSEKMPGEMFKLADWNVSVTSQPMSEVGALAIFLDWYQHHLEFGLEFPGSEMQIVPSKDGKLVKQTVPAAG
jgi:tRNA (cytidine56-2'-O)-methyltransferase